MEQQTNKELFVIKCHKCRHVLIQDAHYSYNTSSCGTGCDNYDVKKFVYFHEDRVPPWIRKKIEEEEWTKGKLHCENCGCKVGSFDYISGRKCDCGKSVLPSIHLVTSQVDIPVQMIKSSIA